MNKLSHFLYEDDFHSPILLRETKTAVKNLILCPLWKPERTLLGAAVCAGLGLNGLQKVLQWTGYGAKNRSWESWFLALPSLCKCCLLSLCIQCLLPYGVLGHTTGLWRSRRTHCPCEASLGNLPSATLQEPRAGNYETAVASAPTSALHASAISLHLYARNSAGICFLHTKEKEEWKR